MSRPRFIFKRDKESSIGRGAEIYTPHFLPEIARMHYLVGVGCQRFNAHETQLDSIATINVTEGHRPQRVEGKRDLHTEYRAFDYTFENTTGNRVKAIDIICAFIKAQRSAADVSMYDLLVHGIGSNEHLHFELDPKA